MSQAAERRLSYDKNLLREADVVLQLRSHGGGFASSSQARPADPPMSNVQVRYSEKAATPSDRRLPFWRTTKGKVLIVVLIVVIIGAVVGAAVGTTVNKSQSVSNSTGQSPGSITPMGPSSVATAVSSLLAPTVTPLATFAILPSESNAIAAMT
ncbi:hypothetical protein JOM56_011202 [Amanita muscaria]